MHPVSSESTYNTSTWDMFPVSPTFVTAMSSDEWTAPTYVCVQYYAPPPRDSNGHETQNAAYQQTNAVTQARPHGTHAVASRSM